jgi:hypothetical protein
MGCFHDSEVEFWMNANGDDSTRLANTSKDSSANMHAFKQRALDDIPRSFWPQVDWWQQDRQVLPACLYEQGNLRGNHDVTFGDDP